jgi:hypothetical protein
MARMCYREPRYDGATKVQPHSIRSPLALLTSAAALAGSGRRWRRPVAAPGASVAMQIHFNDAYELLTSGSDYLKRCSI